MVAMAGQEVSGVCYAVVDNRFQSMESYISRAGYALHDFGKFVVNFPNYSDVLLTSWLAMIQHIDLALLDNLTPLS